MRIRVLAAMSAAFLVLALPAVADGRPLTADLDAANEVGGVNEADAGTTGVAYVTLNQGLGEVCFSIEVDGQATPIAAAHIHTGTADVNGGVVVNFDVANNGLSGCVSADGDLIKDIRQNPSSYYVNVHNSTTPSGAARGQLSK